MKYSCKARCFGVFPDGSLSTLKRCSTNDFKGEVLQGVMAHAALAGQVAKKCTNDRLGVPKHACFTWHVFACSLTIN